MKLKGLILSGGKGTRLRPLTHTSAKQLIPIANKPILYYGIESLVAAGITEIGIVVGETAPEIQAAVGDGSRFGARVTYLQQDAPRGLAHAVLISRAFMGDDRFVVYLGDNVIRDGIAEFAETFRSGDANAMILLAKVPDPRQYGVAKVKGDRVVALVEKPKHPPSNLALVGVYFFDRHIFEECRRLKPSKRGELEITDAIGGLIRHGRNVEHRVIGGWWKDTGRLEDLLEANRILLETQRRRISGRVDAKSKIEGNVVIEKGARIIASTIRGPAVIGPRAVIDHAYVGPFTAIASGVTVKNSEVEHSILLEGCRIEDLSARLVDSLLGRNVTVVRGEPRPRAVRMMLGDNSLVRVL